MRNLMLEPISALLELRYAGFDQKRMFKHVYTKLYTDDRTIE